QSRVSGERSRPCAQQTRAAASLRRAAGSGRSAAARLRCVPLHDRRSPGRRWRTSAQHVVAHGTTTPVPADTRRAVVRQHLRACSRPERSGPAKGQYMKAVSTLDYRALAQRRLPRFLFEYIDGGCYAEVTLRKNVADLERIALRQRVLRDVSTIDVSTTLFGEALALPVALRPV